MKGLFIVITLLVATTLTPALLSAAATGEGTTGPPLSQPLIREGTLAVKLADALKLITTEDEAEAERTLAAAGIVPKNGWISDYPVTPDIIGELDWVIVEAAESGSLPLGKEEALKAFDDLLAVYGLSIRAGTPGEDTAGVPEVPYPDSTVINNYYYDEGPPVVTYYAPPPAYSYLYTWVPYPFWWWDIRWPGFYVLSDFDIRVIGHWDGHGHGHGGRHGHGEYISNHYRDHKTGWMSRIDPARRHHDGKLAGSSGRGWNSPHARKGAEAIINNSRSRIPEGSRKAFIAPSNSGTGVDPSLRRGTVIPRSGGRDGVSRPPAVRPDSSRGYSREKAVLPAYQKAPAFRPQERSLPARSPVVSPEKGFRRGASIDGSYSRPAYKGPAVMSGTRSAPSYGAKEFRAPSSVERGLSYGGGKGQFGGGHRSSQGGRTRR